MALVLRGADHGARAGAGAGLASVTLRAGVGVVAGGPVRLRGGAAGAGVADGVEARVAAVAAVRGAGAAHAEAGAVALERAADAAGRVDRRVGDHRRARHAGVVGAVVAVVHDVEIVRDGLHGAVAVALVVVAVPARLRRDGRALHRVDDAAHSQVAGARLALGVLSGAVVRDQALDAVACSVAERARAAATDLARRERRVRRHARGTDVVGAILVVNREVGVVVDRLERALPVALEHLAIAGHVVARERPGGHGLGAALAADTCVRDARIARVRTVRGLLAGHSAGPASAGHAAGSAGSAGHAAGSAGHAAGSAGATAAGGGGFTAGATGSNLGPIGRGDELASEAACEERGHEHTER